MSDLALFVAAALRDKTIADMQDEIRNLQRRLEDEQRISQVVTITGPKGCPVYAEGSFGDGKYDYSPELWKVDLLEEPSSTKDRQRCLVENLEEMEVRLGGVCKGKLSNGIVEGFVNDLENNYDEGSKSGTVSIWFGGSSGIWLNVTIQPIARHDYAALRDFDLGGESLVATLLQFVAPDAQVMFTEVSFLISYVNGAMQRWRLGNENNNDDDDVEEEDEDNADRTNNDDQEPRRERRTFTNTTTLLRILEEADAPSIDHTTVFEDD